MLFGRNAVKLKSSPPMRPHDHGFLSVRRSEWILRKAPIQETNTLPGVEADQSDFWYESWLRMLKSLNTSVVVESFLWCFVVFRKETGCVQRRKNDTIVSGAFLSRVVITDMRLEKPSLYVEWCEWLLVEDAGCRNRCRAETTSRRPARCDRRCDCC